MAGKKSASNSKAVGNKNAEQAAEIPQVPADEIVEKNEAVTDSRAIEMIPIARLCRSQLNVRTTEFDADIPSLAEAIAATGLKQNLVVIPAHFSTAIVDDPETAKWDELFEVNAGGRRFQALKLLAGEGRLPPDHPVPCLVESRETARETSLDENLHKIAMNPADEFTAYQKIVGDNEATGMETEAAIKACARRFGKTVKHVKERLRLAALAPEILQALRDNRITFDAAKAYAAVSDTKAQLQVFKAQEKVTWEPHKPSSIRDGLRGKSVALDDARVIYLALEAYLEAGGRTENEMFLGSQGQERVMDIPLLDRLVRGKAEGEIVSTAKKDGFESGLFATANGYNPKWPTAPKGFKRPEGYGDDPTKAQKKKSVAVYKLNWGGTALEYCGRFKPDGEPDKKQRPGYREETPEEIAARRRKGAIDQLAHRLAVGPFAGSPLEGRAFWPQYEYGISAIQHGPDDTRLIAILVRVGKDEVDAQLAAAEAKYDEELAAEEASKLEQAKAAAEEHGGDVLDDMDSEEPETEDVE